MNAEHKHFVDGDGDDEEDEEVNTQSIINFSSYFSFMSLLITSNHARNKRGRNEFWLSALGTQERRNQLEPSMNTIAPDLFIVIATWSRENAI
jgi:hypothetical protein